MLQGKSCLLFPDCWKSESGYLWSFGNSSAYMRVPSAVETVTYLRFKVTKGSTKSTLVDNGIRQNCLSGNTHWSQITRPDRCFLTQIQPLIHIPYYYSIYCTPQSDVSVLWPSCVAVRLSEWSGCTLLQGSDCEMSPFNMLMSRVPMVPLGENLTLLDRCVCVSVCNSPDNTHTYMHEYTHRYTHRVFIRMCEHVSYRHTHTHIFICMGTNASSMTHIIPLRLSFPWLALGVRGLKRRDDGLN